MSAIRQLLADKVMKGIKEKEGDKGLRYERFHCPLNLNRPFHYICIC
jgi:hypothetical protein